jgi:hypothetical protein
MKRISTVSMAMQQRFKRDFTPMAYRVTIHSTQRLTWNGRKSKRGLATHNPQHLKPLVAR